MKLYVLKNWLKRLTKHFNNVYRPVVVFRPSGGVFTLFYPSRIPTAKIYHFVTMYYFHPCLLAKSPIAKQNCSHRANVICDGSPSRMRRVRRISLGMTTRPRSSMRRTIPVAFIFIFSLVFLMSGKPIVYQPREIMRISRRRDEF